MDEDILGWESRKGSYTITIITSDEIFNHIPINEIKSRPSVLSSDEVWFAVCRVMIQPLLRARYRRI